VNLTVLTLFPEILAGFFQSSIMAKAVERDIVGYRLVNIRDYAVDKHRTCDDSPYGGGAGMVLKAPPIAAALDAHAGPDSRVVLPSPSGRLFSQELAAELAQEQDLTFICGRYEGVDQRIIDLYVDDEVSIGDYVISSGEVAAMVIIDAVYRLLDGVISKESLEEESFRRGVLEYPHYTRPEEFRGRRVPEILRSGNHAAIHQWRLERSVEKTLRNRPDLLRHEHYGNDVRRVLDELRNQGGNHGLDQGN
jgi:tRNA (guanine37-N1)-methyltransferase